jgi:hypothetical protein
MEEQRNGHINHFNGDWFFDYNVADTEGLTLLDGYFQGRHAFRKLSLPVIRVKYTQDEDFLHNPIFGNGCGPYNDQISWDPVDFGEDLNPISGPHHLVKMSDCGDKYICKRSFVQNNVEWLELGVYARIGAYHIYQAWYLNASGVIRPRVFSKGLSCNLDHWHHPYWRFHFDLDELQIGQVNLFDGPQFIDSIHQETGIRNEDIGRSARYNVENLKTKAKAWIIPPQLDSSHGIVGPTDFARLDGYVRKFRPAEDKNWPHPPEHDIGFTVHDNCDNSDNIFWCICHLFHKSSEGKDHWHSVGPEIQFELPRIPVIPPEQFRKVEVKGTIHIKDFKLVGSDVWGHHDFKKTLTINPNSPNKEIFEQRTTGDVRVDLILRLKLQNDASIHLKIKAGLFDEGEPVKKIEHDFNILKDTATGISGLHLLDYHKGDPDTADIEFNINNAQE